MMINEKLWLEGINQAIEPFYGLRYDSVVTHTGLSDYSVVIQPVVSVFCCDVISERAERSK